MLRTKGSYRLEAKALVRGDNQVEVKGVVVHDAIFDVRSEHVCIG